MYVRYVLSTGCSDRFNKRLRARHRSHTRNAVLQRCSPNRLLVVVRSAAEWRIDREGYTPSLDEVHDFRSTLIDFNHTSHIHTDFEHPRRGSECSQNPKPKPRQLTRD